MMCVETWRKTRRKSNLGEKKDQRVWKNAARRHGSAGPNLLLAHVVSKRQSLRLPL